MRSTFVFLHRWFGLITAAFLFIAGLTGAIISWDHELDEWLNPHLYRAETKGQALPALELASRLEAADKRLMVAFMPLAVEPGHAFTVTVAPRIDPATGKAYVLDFNQVAVNPVTAEVQGKRMWGQVSLSRENLLPFLYKLHYSLHIPDGFGIELGILFMGIIAIIWVIDSFVALWLSFPKWSVWKKSFQFRFKNGPHLMTFDLHRSGGVWVWGLLLIMAVTSVSMNLQNEVTRPVVQLFSTLAESPFASRTPNALDQPIQPTLSREALLKIAAAEAERQQLQDPAGGIFYSPPYGVYGVGFYQPENDHGDGGLGNPWLYFDGNTGQSAGANLPGRGSAGDIFMQAQFPLHSGRILGLPGRILISAMGLVVAMLSITGIIIWLRKARLRRRSQPAHAKAARGKLSPQPQN